MRLATVEAEGRQFLAAITDAGVVDLSSRLSECPDLRSLLANDRLDEARSVAAGSADYPLDHVAFLPPNARADARVYALGWAYKAHQVETSKDAPEFPVVFDKQPQAFVGSGRPLIKPRASQAYDFEGEIALVIGKGGRDIPADQAIEHIAGYTLVMDGSARDYQKHSITAGKNFDSSSACGPWMVTRDEIPDPAGLVLTTRLNGDQVQHSGFDLMVWDIGFLINYLSTIFALQPGDIISTGTPAGVGNRRNPQLFMKAGDVVEVEVSGIGTLRNQVVDQEG